MSSNLWTRTGFAKQKFLKFAPSVQHAPAQPCIRCTAYSSRARRSQTSWWQPIHHHDGSGIVATANASRGERAGAAYAGAFDILATTVFYAPRAPPPDGERPHAHGPPIQGRYTYGKCPKSVRLAPAWTSPQRPSKKKCPGTLRNRKNIVFFMSRVLTGFAHALRAKSRLSGGHRFLSTMLPWST